MKYDCAFVKDNYRFRYRTGAMIISENKMLFVKSKFGNYHYMIGGGVNLGETSKDCIEREIFEETGIHMQAQRLAAVCENFFKGDGGNIDGYDCHVLEFYYLMKFAQEDIISCPDTTDEGEQLVWLPVDKLADHLIKPDFIKERINEILCCDNTMHIVEERDR